MSKVPRTLSRVTYKEDLKTVESQQYDLETLQAATNNFSIDNKIGGGAFGLVYKGNLLDGQEIAVKRLSHDSSQGEKEFRAEIELLTKLQHRNLVRLLGFCLKNGEALLVYELVTNKSLDYFLFDAEMNPKIADFGLARISGHKQTHVHTSKVAGTEGYISPEYRYHGKFSTKSDVYAFGALVLEIIGGRSIGSQSGDLPENLMGTAWRCWTDGKPLELMDPMLKDSCSSEEVLKCIHLGLLCLHDNVDKRPDMSTIVHKLNSNPEAVTLAMPQPGFFYNCVSDQSNTSLTTQSVISSTCDIDSKVWPPFKNCR
ncbi:hypothetical protein KSS87_005089 [Heliosperma pusillum]|nr:hypothetical protein KSS87_005089 [Heliosperma pusillum]